MVHPSFVRILTFAIGNWWLCSQATAAPVCQDIPPPPGRYTCAQQVAWNKCNESWMEGYCMLSCQRCDETAKPQCPGQAPSEAERTDRPYARYQDQSWMSVEEWCRRVHSKRSDPARAGARLVFMGDSITEGWTDSIWQEAFASYRPLRLGIGGDQTQHLLWRIERGELDDLQPELLVLLIGVNNIGYGSWSEADTARGVEAVLEALRRKLPSTPILHLAIFPAGTTTDDGFRLKIARTNALLARIRKPNVSFVDLGSIFLERDGSITSEVMYDYLHPSAEGYRRLAEALKPLLATRLTP